MSTMKRTYSIPNTDVVGIATVLPLALSITKEDEGDDYEVSDEEYILTKKREGDSDESVADGLENSLW